MPPAVGNNSAICVVNAGGWGTALAVLLARSGKPVVLWARREAAATELSQTRENRAYLPGVTLPLSLDVTSDLAVALRGRRIVIVATVSSHLREIARLLAPFLDAEAIVVHGTKGFEAETLLRCSVVLEQELGPRFDNRVAVLSGPTHAEEVARGVPSAAVLACPMLEVAIELQQALGGPTFRLYVNQDRTGVEVCGSLKNVIGLAAGVGDGLGFGDNTRAALITRSLAEMRRLTAALGGEPATVSGLAGLGDVVATCTSQHSRNRWAGEQIGRGRQLDEILASTAKVVEGVPATRSAVALAERHGVDLPICEQVEAVLFRGRQPLQALEALMTREPTHEA
jgi:glycerol-3-phosphate dehydrogenase (NAD(P)+)